MNKQREIIYAERRKVLKGESLRDFMLQTLREKADQAVDQNAPDNVHPSEWNLEEILTEIELVCPIRHLVTVAELEKLDRDGMKERLYGACVAAYEAKEAELTPELMRVIESQYIMLPIIDRMWVDHLYVMDALKTGIGLRGYGQKDPRVEYEKEAYEIFEDLKNNIADEAIKSVFRVVVERQDPDAIEGVDAQGNALPPGTLPDGALANGGLSNGAGSNGQTHGAPIANGQSFAALPDGSLAPQATNEEDAGDGAAAVQEGPMQPSRLDPNYAKTLLGPPPTQKPRNLHTNLGDDDKKPAKAGDKVGRNDACPCGSGKKYKRCHGAAA
jgi:preprotein translocase subunit SecA